MGGPARGGAARGRQGEFRISLLGERVRLEGIVQRIELLRSLKVVLKKMSWDAAEARVRELRGGVAH